MVKGGWGKLGATSASAHPLLLLGRQRVVQGR